MGMKDLFLARDSVPQFCHPWKLSILGQRPLLPFPHLLNGLMIIEQNQKKKHKWLIGIKCSASLKLRYHFSSIKLTKFLSIRILTVGEVVVKYTNIEASPFPKSKQMRLNDRIIRKGVFVILYLQKSWICNLVTQRVKHLPVMRETWVWSLG